MTNAWQRAEAEIRNMIGSFQNHRAAKTVSLSKITRGKIYELYVLAWLLGDLKNNRNYRITLKNGAILTLKQAPGEIQGSDTHFEIYHPATKARFCVYTDIQFQTLGSYLLGKSKLCGYHEIDIVVVDQRASGKPSHTQLVLGIECKSNAKFRKSILKEVLGIRRELSFYRDPPRRSVLATAAVMQQPTIPASPPSEYLLCFVDPDGDKYSESPSAFGIEFKLLKP